MKTLRNSEVIIISRNHQHGKWEYFCIRCFLYKFYAITNRHLAIYSPLYDVSYINFMQSSTRNPYDIVTEGIISTIPIIFSFAKLLQTVESSKLSKISS